MSFVINKIASIVNESRAKEVESKIGVLQERKERLEQEIAKINEVTTVVERTRLGGKTEVFHWQTMDETPGAGHVDESAPEWVYVPLVPIEEAQAEIREIAQKIQGLQQKLAELRPAR